MIGFESIRTIESYCGEQLINMSKEELIELIAVVNQKYTDEIEDNLKLRLENISLRKRKRFLGIF